MHIYLFRHAEKENITSRNPALSTAGHKQAETIVSHVISQKFIKPQLLLTSPKLRAQQTLLPLANKMNIPIKDHLDLDERINPETVPQFLTRVKNHIAWLGKQNIPLFVVTHLDWIEEALPLIPTNVNIADGQYRNWRPAQFMQFEIIDELWNFIEFGSITK